MNEYEMSDEVFRQRALEEDGCVISSAGTGFVNAMNGEEVSLSLTEKQLVQGKIQEGLFR